MGHKKRKNCGHLKEKIKLSGDVHNTNSGTGSFNSGLNNPSVQCTDSSSSCKLKCFYSNVDSLLNKRSELLHVIECDNPDVICLTEILPKNARFYVQPSELQIKGYDCFSNIDGVCDSKRGIVMYIRKDYAAQQVNVDKDHQNTMESVWCELGLDGNNKLLIGTCYRSPNSTKENNDNLNQLFKNMALKSNRKHILIVGDFNYPEINWKDCTSPANHEHRASLFLETVRDSFMHQHIHKPTHCRSDQNPTLIDLIFTPEEGMIEKLEHVAPLGKSHHQCLKFVFVGYAFNRNQTKQVKYMFDKGDYKAMSEKLKTSNLSQRLDGLNIQEAWDLFSSEIDSLSKDFIPVRRFGGRSMKKATKPLWLDDKALAKVKKKREAYKRFIETREGKDYLAYTKARNQAKGACRKAVKDHESSIAAMAKKNPKKFYAYAKSKLTASEGIADLVNEHGEKVTLDKAKAELLNSFFCSVFTKENIDEIPNFANRMNGKTLHNIDIDVNKVKKLLLSIDASKSQGPDNIHPRILKELAEVLAEPLTKIFRLSISQGSLPEQWKTANVTPLFKKGEKTKPNNYRPVSLTSVPCKLLERLIRDAMFEFLDENEAITSCQHGFVSKRSCVTNLVELLEQWTKKLDSGIPIDAIYLDFSKAFDSVPHQRLLKKLEGYGIGGNLLNWLQSFLLGRKQRVKVNGSFSSWEEVTSGVPQGSVMGPVLFILFINDLPEVVEQICSMYADDTKVYGPSKDHDTLQSDLDKLVDWADKWQLRFNAGKCSVIHLGRANNKHEYSMRIHASNDRVKLNSANVEKDLGVLVDNDLQFSQHTETQVNKANRILGLIRRSYEYLDCNSMRLLFTALVRPHLEFANCAWGPRLEKDKKLIEGVLRRATKCVPKLNKLEYEDRIRAIGIPSMSFRRFRGDLIEIYKYTHGYYNCASPFELNCQGPTRGHNYKLRKPSVNTGLRKSFFTTRAVDSWNNLDSNIVNAENINSFKNRIDRAFKSYTFCTEANHPLISPKPLQTELAQFNEPDTTEDREVLPMQRMDQNCEQQQDQQ